MSPRHSRRGSVLAFAAIFVIVFLALASLVVDLTAAMFNHRVMQTATDSVALEAARMDGVAALSLTGQRMISEFPPLEDLALLILGLADFMDEDFTDGIVAGDYDPNADHASVFMGPRADFDEALPADALLVTLRKPYVALIPYALPGGGRELELLSASISQNSSVRSAGAPRPGEAPPLVGTAPFALDLATWNALVTGATVTISVDAAGPAIGRDVLATSIGQQITPALAAMAFWPEAPAAPIFAYVPIFETVTAGGLPQDRTVVGFGLASFRAETSPNAFPIDVSVTKLPAAVAPENASAGAAYSLPGAFTAPEIDALFATSATVDEPLAAPVLVRSYG